MGGFTPETNELADEISKRASGASEKIKQRVQETFIPRIDEMGKFAKRWLIGLQNDFSILVDNPKDECGGGNYEGWTSDELRELRSVLYGEELKK